MIEIGGLLDGRYRIESLLGTGGMGAVYRARQLSVDRTVAIKVLKPGEAPERFIREAQTLAGLKHQNIITVFAFGQEDGQHYLVMEYLEGLSLAGVLTSLGKLPAVDIIDILRQICSALQITHEKGIVHRDLKPDNVILRCVRDQGLRVVVLDFGISKGFGTNADGEKLTKTGHFCGTADYASPEQIQGKSDVDGRADLYSIGVMLYEMLTGQLPFVAGSPVEVLVKHLMAPPPDPREENSKANAKLSQLAVNLMAKDRNNRLANASELLAVLGLIQDGLDPRSSSSAVLPLMQGRSSGGSAAMVSAVDETAPARVTPGQGTAQATALRRSAPSAATSAQATSVVLTSASVDAVSRPSRRHWALLAGAVSVITVLAVAAWLVVSHKSGNAAAQEAAINSPVPPQATAPGDPSTGAPKPPPAVHDLVTHAVANAPSSPALIVFPRRESENDESARRERTMPEVAVTSVAVTPHVPAPEKTQQELDREKKRKKEEEEAKQKQLAELLAQAQVHLSAGSWASAIPKLEQACRLKCTPDTLRKLGDANRRLGKTDTACGYYRKAVKGMAPEKANALLTPFGCQRTP